MRSFGEKINKLVFSWPGYRLGWPVMLIVCALAVAAAGPLVGKFEGAQKNDQSDFLPKNSESVQVSQAQSKLPGADQIFASVVVEREGGLSRADKVKIKKLSQGIREAAPQAKVSRPQPGAGGKAELLTVTYPGVMFEQEGEGRSLESLSASLDKLRGQVSKLDGGGLKARVGGQLGFAGDSIEIFKTINSTLLYATGLLVLILLLIIYRSPIFWVLPMIAVVAAEIIARAGGYLLAKAGVVVTGQSAGILSVLVFGAGTDYALLLVARYREELRIKESPRQAMQVALQRTGPTILASGSTVIAGLLCLQLAKVNAIAGLGPAGAVGVLAAMISAVTLLPALLVAGGRKAFWPLVPRLGSRGADAQSGAWRRIGQWVERRRRSVIVCSLASLILMGLGMQSLKEPLSSDRDFRGQVESIQAQQIIEKSFPAGSTSPTVVLAKGNQAEVRERLEAQPSVVGISPPQAGPEKSSLSLISLTLVSDPSSQAAIEDIQEIRSALKGSGALVGGSAAQEADLREATARDNKILIPVITALVLLILIVLLRSIVMPLILVSTVLISFAASLGAVAFISVHILGAPGVPISLPIISFVFLVALGIDYNIFLAARAREETARHGTREGMLRALAVTGAVITSAGVVLAGTFSVLMVLPLWTLTEIGLAVAFGVLLDTILVRSMLVPAITWSLSDRAWWPWRPGSPTDR